MILVSRYSVIAETHRSVGSAPFHLIGKTGDTAAPLRLASYWVTGKLGQPLPGPTYPSSPGFLLSAPGAKAERARRAAVSIPSVASRPCRAAGLYPAHLVRHTQFGSAIPEVGTTTPGSHPERAFWALRGPSHPGQT